MALMALLSLFFIVLHRFTVLWRAATFKHMCVRNAWSCAMWNWQTWCHWRNSFQTSTFSTPLCMSGWEAALSFLLRYCFRAWYKHQFLWTKIPQHNTPRYLCEITWRVVVYVDGYRCSILLASCGKTGLRKRNWFDTLSVGWRMWGLGNAGHPKFVCGQLCWTW